MTKMTERGDQPCCSDLKSANSWGEGRLPVLITFSDWTKSRVISADLRASVQVKLREVALLFCNVIICD